MEEMLIYKTNSENVKDILLHIGFDIHKSTHSHFSSCERAQTPSQRQDQMTIVEFSPKKAIPKQASGRQPWGWEGQNHFLCPF